MDEQLNPFYYIWFALSAAILARWLAQTRWGRNAFAGIALRRHNLNATDVLVVALGYVLILIAMGQVQGQNDSPSDLRQNLALLVLVAGQLLIAGFAVRIGANRCANHLAGWGLTKPYLTQAARFAPVYFVTATGLTLMTLAATIKICQIVGYPIVQKHQLLEMLGQDPNPTRVALLVLSAVLAAPLAEEFLFRGLLQNCLIGALTKRYENTDPAEQPEPAPDKYRWLGIVTTAVIFAVFHGDWQHWPALFVLGTFLGYTYERHGNLCIPILVHSLFNLLPVAVSLVSSP